MTNCLRACMCLWRRAVSIGSTELTILYIFNGLHLAWNSHSVISKVTLQGIPTPVLCHPRGRVGRRTDKDSSRSLKLTQSWLVSFWCSTEKCAMQKQQRHHPPLLDTLVQGEGGEKGTRNYLCSLPQISQHKNAPGQLLSKAYPRTDGPPPVSHSSSIAIPSRIWSFSLAMMLPLLPAATWETGDKKKKWSRNRHREKCQHKRVQE